MPSPNLRFLNYPLGPVRDFWSDDLDDDVERAAGFLAVAVSDGDVTFRTLHGAADQTQTLEAGQWVGPRADMPCVLSAIRDTSTVTSVYVCIL